jgi:RNA polymerase sigma factor (sigma-70 family)
MRGLRPPKETLSAYQQSLVAGELPYLPFYRRKFAAYLAYLRAAGIGREDADAYIVTGLCKAAAKYDPGRGVKFRTYAPNTVWGVLSDMCRKVTHEGGPAFYRATGESDPGRRRCRRQGDEGPAGGRPRGAWRPDPADRPAADTARPVERGDAEEQVKTLLSRLAPRERDVIRRRFGIGRKPQQIREIARALGVSKSRVGQVINLVLKKLAAEA